MGAGTCTLGVELMVQVRAPARMLSAHVLLFIQNERDQSCSSNSIFLT